MKNKFYIIFFDLKLNSSRIHYPANVYAVIEELRLNYFRNKSMKISDKTLLVVTEEEIIDTYPNISSWIEDITISLTDKNRFIDEDFKHVQWFIFTPDDDKIEELKNSSLEIEFFFEYLENRDEV